MPPGDHSHLAALGLQLGKQRRLLRRRPLPTSLDARDNLDRSHGSLLLELQRESPEKSIISDRAGTRYTSQTGLQLPTSSRLS